MTVYCARYASLTGRIIVTRHTSALARTLEIIALGVRLGAPLALWEEQEGEA